MTDTKEDFRNKLTTVFDLQPKVNQIIEAEPVERRGAVVSTEQRVEEDEDYVKARQTLARVMELGKDALESLVAVAKDSESPKAFDPIAGLVKSIADASKNLVEVQVQKREALKIEADLEGRATPANQKNVQNNVFVGSTKELLDMMKKGE